MQTVDNAQPTSRPPAIAGSFYPRRQEALSVMVDQFMDEIRQQEADTCGTAPVPKALIVPHAGYRFSGAIAARAYARILPAADTIKRVVIFGPAHKVAVKGLAVPSVDAFETPLGTVELDREYLAELGAQAYTEVSDDAHAAEHCLEIQLPFLQKILGDFRLTPVLVGGASGETVEDALQRVWGGAETLIVISSDLSHYHPYDEAQKMDTASSLAIMTLQAGKLRSKTACGWRSVNGLLRRVRTLGLNPAALEVKNSGDTASSHDRVVGYGAWSFAQQMDTTDVLLTEEMKQGLLRVAKKTIKLAAMGKPMPGVSVGTFAPALQRPGASFVTLTRNGRLRGCLGTLMAYRPLVLDIVERSFATTLKDPRFKPVKTAELPGMHLEIAVLTAAKPMTFTGENNLLQALRPGKDGLIIEDAGKRATFLPKVWDEIPDAGKFLGRLKEKAGLPRDHWSDSFRAWRYETVRFSSTFSAT